jgi:saccharopine dehydrogenase-like NADP-dependent oxidoreductase
MKTILILGAGRSSASLIEYLLKAASEHSWNVIVGDLSLAAAQERVGQSPVGKAMEFDIDQAESTAVIGEADLVISLLPAHLHPKVAEKCLFYKKHLITASYVSSEMQALHQEASTNGLLFLNECGLDPGIDHMSAMRVIDRVRSEGGVITSFESFTGGLIAPETDPENPWRYKFTWNPRNVVMAGQGTACFLQEGQYKYIPYQQLFKRTTEIHVAGFGDYEGYANRDSLKYMDTYNLRGVKTMLRGTLRNRGYCSAWNVLVQLGCCDDSYRLEGVNAMSHRDFINSFLAYHDQLSVEEKIQRVMNISSDSEEMKRLKWSGFFSDESVGMKEGSPAQITEHILNKKWKLQPYDRDMIVMWHQFGVEMGGSKKVIQATLVAQGDDSIHTAMAKTVGLPMAIAAKLVLLDKIKTRGVAIPTTPEFYTPVLDELETLGIMLTEREV